MVRSISLIQSRIPERNIETTEHYLKRGGMITVIPAGRTGIALCRGRDLFREFYFRSAAARLMGNK